MIMRDFDRHLVTNFLETAGTICALVLILLFKPACALCQILEDGCHTQSTVEAIAQPMGDKETVKSFTLMGTVNVRLSVKSSVAPTLQIASYTTGGEQIAFVTTCLIATGAGLVFVAPLATVPAAIGPMANTAAGAAATGAAAGEAWSIDRLLGGSRAKILKEAVASVNLVASLQNALERFLRVEDMPAGETQAELNVVIDGYGFQSSQADEICCFIDVRTFLRLPGSDCREDRIFVGQGAEGDDIPPAYCTKLKRFLENKGSPARQAMEDSTEIAAAVIAQRLYRRQP